MNEWSVFLAGAGLLLDIGGVCLLFLTTSARRVEAEIAFNILRETTDKTVEWNESYSSEEHKRGVANAGHRVRRNIHWARFGLALIVTGFSLQFLGLIIAEWK